jgi:ATP-binding cassette, subfamily B, bacterial
MQTPTGNLADTNLRLLLQTARWALHLTWSSHRRLMTPIVTITLARSLMPAALALAVRGLINAVAAVIGGDVTHTNEIMLWLALGLIITLIDTVGDFGHKFFIQRLDDELNLQINTMILEHAARLDVAYFEDSRFQDIMDRTQQGVARRFTLFVSKALYVVTGLLQMVSLAVILAVIEPLILLVLGIVALPYLIFNWRLARSRYRMEFQRVTKERWTRYFVTRLTGQQHVPEVKLLRLAPLLLQKFQSLMSEFRDQNSFYARRLFVGGSFFAFCSMLAFYATFARVALRVLEGGLTIGDVAIYGGAMARLQSTLQDVIQNVTGGLEHTLHIANLRHFLAIEPQIDKPASEGIALPGSRGEIRLTDVVFTYPGAKKPTLNGVSLHIAPGETVAIVGLNGAGKTTLVKLIARLYEPQQGQICFDGVDIQKLSLDYLHSQTAFVFQGFGRYEATVADNIAYGNWRDLLGQTAKIEAIARRVDAHEMINTMPDGYNTLLGRMFGEYTLSGGQWQKIALARAFARDAALLILDEPTSNLDAQTEYRIFNDFRQLAQGRTTILISHRFSTVSMADRILVMEQGQLIENGTHEQLMVQNGRYALLYNLHRAQFQHENEQQIAGNGRTTAADKLPLLDSHTPDEQGKDAPQ